MMNTLFYARPWHQTVENPQFLPGGGGEFLLTVPMHLQLERLSLEHFFFLFDVSMILYSILFTTTIIQAYNIHLALFFSVQIHFDDMKLHFLFRPEERFRIGVYVSRSVQCHDHPNISTRTITTPSALISQFLYPSPPWVPLPYISLMRPLDSYIEPWSSQQH